MLAEGIQRLSVEARGLTAAVSRTLLDITGITGVLAGRADGDAGTREHAIGGLESGLAGVLTTLRRLHECVVNGFCRLEIDVQGMLADIEAAIDAITVHERMGADLGEIIGELERYAAASRLLAPPDPEDVRTERLRKLASLYTMQSERTVHANVAGGSDASGSAEGSLGDNIELF